MIDNLSYIYIAMYALDLYHSLDSFLSIMVWGIPIAFGMALFITGFNSNDGSDFVKNISYFKKFYIVALVLYLIFLPMSILMPSENTIKAYMGVKAVQSVAVYLETKTDIPERSKATLTKLWDRVDGYLTTIDIGKVVDKAKASAPITGVPDSTLSKIKEQVRDSIIKSLSK